MPLKKLLAELEQKQREKDGLDQKPPKNLSEYYQNKINRANAIRKKNEEREYNRRNGIKKISDSQFDFSRERLGNIGDDNVEAYHRREEMAKGIAGANYNNRIKNEGNYGDDGNIRDKDLKASDYTNFVDHTLDAAKKGGYQFLEGFSHLARGVGALIETPFGDDSFEQNIIEGNVVQQAIDSLIEQGKLAADYNLPPELQKENYSLSDLLNPVWWAEFGGSAIPEIADIVVSMMLTGGTKSALQKGITTGAKAILKETGEAVGNKVIKNVASKSAREVAEAATRKSFVSRILGQAKTTTMTEAGVKESMGSGSGILGKLITDRGTLTEGFDKIATPVIAGFYSNLQTSLKAGGDVYSSYKDVYERDEFGRVLKDEEGNPIRTFNDDELGRMASGAFYNNMQYLAMDMLSWAVTFGKGTTMLDDVGKSVINGVKETTPKILKTSSSMFTNSVSPVIGKLASKGKDLAMSGKVKWAGKVLGEGLEEVIQETFEEWSKMKSYYDVVGSLKGYEGAKPGQKMMSFYDYMMSEDSTNTQIIAGAIGGLIGGGFNIKTLINGNADKAHGFKDRAYYLSNQFKKESEGKDGQVGEIYMQMAELVSENKGSHFKSFLDKLLNDNIIDEDEYVAYGRTYNEIAYQNEKIKDLNIRGKKAFTLNVAEEMRAKFVLDGMYDRYKSSLQTYRSLYDQKVQDIMSDESLSDQERRDAIADAWKEFEENKQHKTDEFYKGGIKVAQVMAQARNNQEELIKNKSAEPIQWDIEFWQDNDTELNIPVLTKRPKKDYEINTDKNTESNQEGTDEDIDFEESIGQRVKREANEFLNNSKYGKKAKSYIDKLVSGISSMFNKNEDYNDENNEEKESNNDDIQEKSKGSIDELKKAVKSGKAYDVLGLGKKINTSNVSEDEDGEIGFDFEVEDNYDMEYEVTPKDKYGNFGVAEVDPKTGRKKALINHSYGSEEEAKKVAKGLKGKKKKKSVRVQKAKTQGNKIISENGDVLRDFDIENNKNQKDENNNEQQKPEEQSSESNKGKQDDSKQEQKPKSEQPKGKEDKSDDGVNEVTEDGIIKEGSNPQPKSITKEDMNLFKKNKQVKVSRLLYLADKVFQNEKLNKNEKKIYEHFKDTVDAIVQQDIESLEEELEANNIDKENLPMAIAILRNAKGKSIDDVSILKDMLSGTTELDDDDAFSGRYRFNPIKGVKNAFKGRSMNRPQSLFKKAINKMKSINFMSLKDDEDYAFDLNRNFRNLAQSIVVSNALKKTYPDMNINVFSIRGMQKQLGLDGLGYTIAGQIFIEDAVWEDKRNLFHENSHIYFALSKDDPHTQNLLKFALRNKKLVDRILKDYDDQVLYRNSSDGEVRTKDFYIRNYVLPYIRGMESEQDPEVLFKQLVDDGVIEMVPMEEQDIILDEVFAAALEGPLNDKYSQFWDEKSTPEAKDSGKKRKFFISRWLNMLKERGKKTFDDLDERKAFFETLNEDEQVEYSDTLNYIMDRMAQGGITGTDKTMAGRYRIIEEEETTGSNRKEAIAKRIESEFKKYKDGLTISQVYKKINDDNLEEYADKVDFQQLFDIDRFKYANKVTDMIRNFSSFWNKAVLVKNRNNEIKGNLKRLPFLKPERLRYHLNRLVKEADNSLDFIKSLEDSEYNEVKYFMEYIKDKSKDDAYLIFNSFYFVENSSRDITGIQVFVNEDGNVRMHTSLSQREINMLDRKYTEVLDDFTVKKNKYGSYSRKIEYRDKSRIQRSMENIHRNNDGIYNDQDLFNVFSYFAPYGVDLQAIWEGNTIEVNGQLMPLKKAIQALIRSKENSIFDGYYKGQPVFNVKKKNDKGNTVEVPYVRHLITGIVNENRKYTANQSVIDADQNQHSSRIINNQTLEEFDRMANDFKQGMSKQKFISKYSAINKKGEGSRSNLLLGYIYEDIKRNGKVSVFRFAGVNNDSTKKNAKLEENTKESMALNNLTLYLSSFNGDVSKSFLMDMGRFSDSNTALLMRVPTHNVNDYLVYENGRFIVKDKKIPASLVNVYNTGHTMGNYTDIRHFSSVISQSIQSDIEFFENQISETGINHAKLDERYFKNGKFTQKGKELIASYSLSNIINKSNLGEILYSGLKFNKINEDKDTGYTSVENQLAKRAKAGISPNIKFGDNVKLEVIYIDDIVTDGYDTTDAGGYALEQDLERVRMAGGPLMDLGHSFKMLHAGIERSNPNMINEGVYNKANITILNDEVVAKNPQLKEVYEVLKARREKYVKIYGEPSANLLDGTPNYFPIVYPHTANKTLKYPKFYSKENGKPLLSFDNIDLESANNLLDQMYYGKDENGEYNSFIGLEGNSFGVQQVIDGKKNKISMPVQLLKSLGTDSIVNGTQKEVENLLNDIHNLSQKQLDKLYNVVMNGSDIELKEIIDNYIDKEYFDKNQYEILFNEKLDIKTPYVRNAIKNILSSMVKKNGVKLETPGDIAVEKPSTYHKVIKQKDGSYKYVKTSHDLSANKGSHNLQFNRKDSNGVIHAGEVVVSDSFLNEDGRGLKKRQYITTDNPTPQSLDKLEAEAKFLAKKRNVLYGKVFDDKDNHIGYYVQGDLIMATRIPSHGVQSTGLFEIVDTTGEKGNNIQLPDRFKQIIGSDNDGDKIFIQHKSKSTPNWNKIFDQISNIFLNPKMQWQLNQMMDFDRKAKDAIQNVKEYYGYKDDVEVHPFSISGDMKTFDDTIASKNNVGIVAALHSGMRMLASYGVNTRYTITINNTTSSSFKDIEGQSTSINSAILLNLMVDNSKWAFASKLGLSDSRIPIASTLINMGFELNDIALILNHPLTQKYAKNKEISRNVYSNEGEDVFADYREKLRKDSKVKDIVIDFKKRNSNEINYNIAKLLTTIDSFISDEFSKLQGVLSSHSKMETSAFMIDKKISEAGDVLSNANRFLNLNESYINSPIVKNYITAMSKNKDIQGKIDPVYSNTELKELYDELSSLFGSSFGKKHHEIVENALNSFYSARMLGLNLLNPNHYINISKIGHKDNLFDRIENYKNKLESELINSNQSLNKLDNNLLFSKGLSFNGKGNAQYISINNEFLQNNSDEYTRKQLIDEFNALPDDIKRDLLLYDLVKNAWTGPKSLFPLFSDDVKLDISDATRDLQKVSNKEIKTLKRRILSSNSDLIKKTDNMFVKNKDGKVSINREFLSDKNHISKSISRGKPFMTKTVIPGDKTERIIIFSGFEKETLDVYNHSDFESANEIILDHITQFPVNKSFNDNTPYITVNDGNIDDNLKDDPVVNSYQNMVNILNEGIANNKESNNGRERRRGPKSDYYGYIGRMNKEEFDSVMNYPQNYPEDKKTENFEYYKREKDKAEVLSNFINDDTVKNMSYDELISIYSEEYDLKDKFDGKYGEGQGIGWRNKFAYANVIRPVLNEIARREAAEQNKILNEARKKYGIKPLDEKDISFWDKWLLANDIPSSNPAVQRVVRTLESEHKKFTEERAKRLGRINKATDMIFQEKFGYKPLDGNLWDKVKHIIHQMFSNKENFYRTLYGPLIIEEEIISDTTGKKIKNMRYKSQEEIEKGLQDGSISKGQYEFYKVTREISNELIKNSGAEQREGYIPHIAPGMMEALSRRGLLGMLVSTGDRDERINDVKIKVKNPETGKEELVEFSVVKDWYSVLSRSKSPLLKSFDYIKAKKKAIIYLNKGINEDGTAIEYSNQRMGSAMGDVFMDRFSNARNVFITEFPSLDLNKAFSNYVDSTLFVHGNENYKGVKKLFPLVDAILSDTQRKDHKNMYQLIEKNWKEYFINRRKQDILPTPAIIEAMGITTDKAIKFITQGSLIYWLGIKGLMIGGGAYVIGNVLAGKYRNLLNAGGESLRKGEGRFWLGKSGKFSLTDPFKGVRESNEILKNAGFMDINIYDEVSLSEKKGLEQTFMGMALFPMSYSEKWIQGSHFLGLLTDEEWDTLKNGGKLSEDRMVQLEDEVNRSHGKGYQPTNQRMIQMYSWGNMMMQFSKFIPTTIYDKFAKEDIDRFGNYSIGSYRKVYHTIQKAVDGRWSPSDFMKYRKSLNPEERKRLDAGLMGFGLSSLLIGLGISTDSKWMKDIVSDDNIFADYDRMKYKMTNIPSVAMFNNIL